ncbi:MAG: HlyD family type I secretion periplasmic adaptor subunit [Betaproteobacteria bacterium]|nr:HlyD family type I secretion periplasmic adaptor subunit [Betaproteobacteria bacterium]
MKIFWFLESGEPGRDRRILSRDLRRSRLTLWTTAFSLAVFVTWAYFAEIDQITRAPGQVIASQRSQVIQSQDGGIIEQLLVKDGDTVDRGQILVRLERARSEASFLEARAKSAGLTATVARLRAEVFGGEPAFPPMLSNYPQIRENQLVLFHKRKAAIDEEVTALQNLLQLAQRELEMTQPLLKTGDVSRTEVLRLERQVAEVTSQITNKRNRYFQDAQAELSKALEDLAGIEQTMAQRMTQVDQTELRAPLHGVVKNVRITTRGGVIRPGEEVMQIVPLEDDLLVEARVMPADIAFIKPGLSATVKIDAYDYTIYGDLPGKLTYISPDTLTEDLRQGEQPYYRVRVRTDGRRFSGRPNEDLEIQPGMTATVEIRTGTNTVLKYLTKPVVKTLSEALRER